MQSLKNSTKVLLVMLLAVAVGACSLLGEKDRTYSGEAKVGFKHPTPAGNITSDTTRSFEIQLIRSQSGVLSQDLPVEFTVVDSTTTAPEASYEILTSSPVTIPQEELVTDIKIKFNPSAIPTGKAGTLEIYLKGNEQQGIEGDENIGHLNLLIIGSG